MLGSVRILFLESFRGKSEEHREGEEERRRGDWGPEESDGGSNRSSDEPNQGPDSVSPEPLRLVRMDKAFRVGGPGVPARLTDPGGGAKTSPAGVANSISDYVMGALGAGLTIEAMSERLCGEALPPRVPRAGRSAGRCARWRVSSAWMRGDGSASWRGGRRIRGGGIRCRGG